MTVLALLAGLIALVVGAELFVRGASRIAAGLGITPLIIGLTVVSIGTSTPEIAISVLGALDGQSDIAVGNAVGSNIFNVLFILGLSALIAPLVVARQLVRIEVPLMVALSLLVLGLGWNGAIGRGEGLLLLVLGAAYTTFLIRQARRSPSADDDSRTADAAPRIRGRSAWALSVLVGVVGLALLIVGCRWFVSGAVDVSRTLGISELVIGLTIVAAGTSLPEVATSVVASIRGERDIAVGNVVGSNIYNIFLVLGASSAVAPDGLTVGDTVRHFDLPVMIAVAFACLPIFFTGYRIDRWEGVLFLCYYAAYVAWLVVEGAAHPAWIDVRTSVLLFTLPLMVLTLGVVFWRSSRRTAREAL